MCVLSSILVELSRPKRMPLGLVLMGSLLPTPAMSQGYVRADGVMNTSDVRYQNDGFNNPEESTSGYGASFEVGSFLPLSRPWQPYAGLGVGSYQWQTKTPSTPSAGELHFTAGMGIQAPFGPFAEARLHVLEWNDEETSFALNGKGLGLRAGLEFKQRRSIWVQAFYEWRQWKQDPGVSASGPGLALGWIF